MVHVACNVTDHIPDLAELKLAEVQSMITKLLVFLKLLKRNKLIKYIKYYVGKIWRKAFPHFLT